MDKWYLLKHTYNLKVTIMKVELGIKTTSNVVAANGCPKLYESSCGIAYRG